MRLNRTGDTHNGSDNPSCTMFNFFELKLSRCKNIVNNKLPSLPEFHLMNSFPLETDFFFAIFKRYLAFLKVGYL